VLKRPPGALGNAKKPHENRLALENNADENRNCPSAQFFSSPLGDWLVVIAVACLSLTVLPGPFRAARTGRWDILALQSLFAFVVIWLDGALVNRRIRMRRTQRSV